MRIGFDISQTGKDKAGCGYFAYSLAHTLLEIAPEHEYTFYPSFGPYYWDPSVLTGDLLRAVRGKKFGMRSFSKGRRAKTERNYWESVLDKPDIIHSNNFYVPLGLKNTRFVYTLYDISFLHHPEWHTEMNWVVTTLGGVYYASLMADAIIAISTYSKKDFLEMFPYYPAERIHTVSLASRFPLAGVQDVPPRNAQLEPNAFWLVVGTVEPRKNYTTLLNAYADLVKKLPNTFPLVIAGGQGWRTEYLKSMINSLAIQEKVYVLGYVSDATLQWLYRNCYAFIYPSLFEGFGLPPLEAMSMGAAVIASKSTSIPEVTADAAILVPPTDVTALKSAMERLLQDKTLHGTLKRKALLRANKFSWSITAKDVLKIYEKVLLQPKIWQQ